MAVILFHFVSLVPQLLWRLHGVASRGPEPRGCEGRQLRGRASGTHSSSQGVQYYTSTSLLRHFTGRCGYVTALLLHITATLSECMNRVCFSSSLKFVVVLDSVTKVSLSAVTVISLCCVVTRSRITWSYLLRLNRKMSHRQRTVVQKRSRCHRRWTKMNIPRYSATAAFIYI